MEEGTQRAWSLMEEKGPEAVSRDTGVEYDPGCGCYRLISLGLGFMICPGKRTIEGATDEAMNLYCSHALYLEHSVLWFMASSTGAGLTGRLIKPSDLRGGHHFFTRGTHRLPLDNLAAVYARDAGGFVQRGLALGGARRDYGDAAVELRPLPPVPVVIALWEADDEFPARADLFFDSSAEYHAPLDALWAAAMLTIGAMM